MKWVMALAFVAVAAPAAGQPQSDPRFTVGAGITWSGGYAIGDASGVYRTNASGTTPPPFTLFSTASDIAHVTGFDTRVGYAPWPSISIEGGASINFPHVTVAVTNDVESSPQTLEGERLQQYLFDAGVVWRLPMAPPLGLMPFVTAGGGYLRQLHEERTLVETGQIYYVGGGARYWVRRPALSGPAMALNALVRANIRNSGIDFENKSRVFPVFALHLLLQL